MFTRSCSLAAFAVAALLLLSCAPGAGAQEIKRLVWQHSEGTFTDKGDRNWGEANKDGVPSFRFRETERNADFVELYDASRDLTARLYKDSLLLKIGKLDFIKYYDGKWVK